VLAEIRSPEDVPRAIENTLISGDVKAVERETLEQKIRDVFNIPRVREWFDPARADDIFVESPIMTASGVLIPDRVIVSGGKAEIVDFKTGGTHPAHTAQVREYMELLKGMGYEKIEAYILYLDSGEIVEVVL
jgi:CRISPR/Cas system-associated exonuclease Cas4 (RecB family)